MKTMNKVFLIGNLGNDPELRVSENGATYTRLSIATHSSREKEDQYEQIVQWHSVYVWGAQAENCAQWLAKGALVFVEGEVRQMEFKKDAAANQRFSLIHAREVKFLSPKKANLDNLARPRNHDAVAQR